MRAYIERTNFHESFKLIKATLMGQYEQTKFNQNDERTEIWRKLQSLEWVKKELTEVIVTGEMSQKTLLDRLKKKVF